ncbi:hypothetical protein HTT03_04285 [Sulfitobacter sp. S0837]|nr:hypothetical protein [Sulfitobacter maritimus]
MILDNGATPVPGEITAYVGASRAPVTPDVTLGHAQAEYCRFIKAMTCLFLAGFRHPAG